MVREHVPDWTEIVTTFVSLIARRHRSRLRFSRSPLRRSKSQSLALVCYAKPTFPARDADMVPTIAKSSVTPKRPSSSRKRASTTRSSPPPRRAAARTTPPPTATRPPTPVPGPSVSPRHPSAKHSSPSDSSPAPTTRLAPSTRQEETTRRSRARRNAPDLGSGSARGRRRWACRTCCSFRRRQRCSLPRRRRSLWGPGALGLAVWRKRRLGRNDRRGGGDFRRFRGCLALSWMS